MQPFDVNIGGKHYYLNEDNVSDRLKKIGDAGDLNNLWIRGNLKSTEFNYSLTRYLWKKFKSFKLLKIFFHTDYTHVSTFLDEIKKKIQVQPRDSERTRLRNLFNAAVNNLNKSTLNVSATPIAIEPDEKSESNASVAEAPSVLPRLSHAEGQALVAFEAGNQLLRTAKFIDVNKKTQRIFKPGKKPASLDQIRRTTQNNPALREILKAGAPFHEYMDYDSNLKDSGCCKAVEFLTGDDNMFAKYDGYFEEMADYGGFSSLLSKAKTQFRNTPTAMILKVGNRILTLIYRSKNEFWLFDPLKNKNSPELCKQYGVEQEGELIKQLIAKFDSKGTPFKAYAIRTL